MVEHVCPDCHGARLRTTRLKFEVAGRNIDEPGRMNFDELRPFLDTIEPRGPRAEAGTQIVREIARRIDLLLGIGLDYLNFNRASGTISGGEAQRIRLSTQIGSGLMGMLYVLDEPSIGLHPKDNVKMIEILRSLRDLGNTVIVVEHDADTIRAADHVLELGPGPGIHGGEVVVAGTLDEILRCPASPTGQYLSGQRRIETPIQRREINGKSLLIHGARANNLEGVDVEISLGQFVCVSGASGSGRSTLANEILYKELWKRLVDSRSMSGAHDALEGVDHLPRVINIDQSPIGRNSRSNPSTYVRFYDQIRNLFASTRPRQGTRLQARPVQFQRQGRALRGVPGGGRNRHQVVLHAGRGSGLRCLQGPAFQPRDTGGDLQRQERRRRARSIHRGRRGLLPAIGRKIDVLNDLGLGYLTLGQSATTLSGGEAQHIKLATELSKLQRRGHVLYILDDPTTGLRLTDISKLLDCLHRLVDAEHTVLVIEHHLDVIKTADHVIDLGPEGGRGGGEVVAVGTPEDIAACEASHTGRYLRAHL